MTSMQVGTVMTREVETVTPHSTLQEAAAKMKALDIGILPVCEGGRLLGMITDRDITIRAVAHGHDPFGDRVRDVMTPFVITCYEDQDIDEAARLMREKEVRRLVVLDRGGQLAGVLSLDDIAGATDETLLAGETLEQVSRHVRR